MVKLKHLIGYPDILNLYNKYIQQFASEYEAQYCLTHKDDSSNHLCPICGKILQFKHNYKHKHYCKTCGSKECIYKIIHSDEVQKKREETSLRKFNAKNPFSSEVIKKKIEQINIKRYGYKNPMQNMDIRKKAEQTLLKTKGVPNIMQCTIEHSDVWIDDNKFSQYIPIFMNKNVVI